MSTLALTALAEQNQDAKEKAKKGGKKSGFFGLGDAKQVVTAAAQAKEPIMLGINDGSSFAMKNMSVGKQISYAQKMETQHRQMVNQSVTHALQRALATGGKNILDVYSKRDAERFLDGLGGRGSRNGEDGMGGRKSKRKKKKKVDPLKQVKARIDTGIKHAKVKAPRKKKKKKSKKLATMATRQSEFDDNVLDSTRHSRFKMRRSQDAARAEMLDRSRYFVLRSLQDVWNYLDSDQSGDLSTVEFFGAIAKLNYQGVNVNYLYHLMDLDGDLVSQGKFFSVLDETQSKIDFVQEVYKNGGRKAPLPRLKGIKYFGKLKLEQFYEINSKLGLDYSETSLNDPNKGTMETKAYVSRGAQIVKNKFKPAFKAAFRMGARVLYDQNGRQIRSGGIPGMDPDDEGPEDGGESQNLPVDARATEQGSDSLMLVSARDTEQLPTLLTAAESNGAEGGVVGIRQTSTMSSRDKKPVSRVTGFGDLLRGRFTVKPNEKYSDLITDSMDLTADEFNNNVQHLVSNGPQEVGGNSILRPTVVMKPPSPKKMVGFGAEVKDKISAMVRKSGAAKSKRFSLASFVNQAIAEYAEDNSGDSDSGEDSADEELKKNTMANASPKAGKKSVASAKKSVSSSGSKSKKSVAVVATKSDTLPSAAEKNNSLDIPDDDIEIPGDSDDDLFDVSEAMQGGEDDDGSEDFDGEEDPDDDAEGSADDSGEERDSGDDGASDDGDKDEASAEIDEATDSTKTEQKKLSKIGSGRKTRKTVGSPKRNTVRRNSTTGGSGQQRGSRVKQITKDAWVDSAQIGRLMTKLRTKVQKDADMGNGIGVEEVLGDFPSDFSDFRSDSDDDQEGADFNGYDEDNFSEEEGASSRNYNMSDEGDEYGFFGTTSSGSRASEEPTADGNNMNDFSDSDDESFGASSDEDSGDYTDSGESD